MSTELAVRVDGARAGRRPFGTRAALRALEQAERDHRHEVRDAVEKLLGAERAYQREVTRRTGELAAAGRQKLVARAGVLALYELELLSPEGRVPLAPAATARVAEDGRHAVLELGATRTRLKIGRDVDSARTLRWFAGLVNAATAAIGATEDRIAARVARARERLAEALLAREPVERQADVLRAAVASDRLQEACETVAGGFTHGPQAAATLARVRTAAALTWRLRDSAEHELARVEADSALARVSAGRLLDGSAR